MKTTLFSIEDFFSQDISQRETSGMHRLYTVNDYATKLQEKQDLVEKYKKLPDEEKRKYKDMRRYFEACGFKELSPNEKNYQFFTEEIKAQIEKKDNPNLVYMSSLSEESDVLELLHSFENIEKLKELYKYQKRTCKSTGINVETAEQLRYCFMQGRELFCSGKRSDISVKPLLFFYSLTAYAFGIIVLNSPIRFGLDMLNGHHGLDYIHDKFTIKFGGDTPYGTFTDLFQSIPVYSLLDTEGHSYKQNRFYSIESFFTKETEIKLGSLFGYIPELSAFLPSITKNPGYCHHVTVQPTSQEREWGYEIVIGDGKERLDSFKSELDFIFKTEGTPTDGKLKYFVRDKDFQSLNVNIYQDVYGKPYLVHDKVGYVIPELLVHFMILFAFSNIQRYDPPLWGEILSNKINSSISYLIYRYFSVFEHKLPYLILKTVGSDYPILA